MIIFDNEVVTKSDSDESMPSLEDASDDGVKYAAVGEALVTRCVLNSQVKKRMTWSNKGKASSMLVAL